MDLQSAAATELPKWEPFIRRFVARDWMRSRLAIETDDVRQECRWRALQAIVNLHHNKPHLVGKPDEIRIVNRAIARAFVDLIRKANRLSRCTDDTTKYTIESGASWLPMASTRTLEEEYLDGEREQDVRRACAEIQAIMGDDVYYDVLRVLDWLKGCGHQEIHLAAKGWGAIPATFAALLSDDVVQVTLKNALTSYAEIAESEDYQWPLSTLLPDVLKRFDLPDCYRELAGKKLANTAQIRTGRRRLARILTSITKIQ